MGRAHGEIEIEKMVMTAIGRTDDIMNVASNVMEIGILTDTDDGTTTVMEGVEIGIGTEEGRGMGIGRRKGGHVRERDHQSETDGEVKPVERKDEDQEKSR